MRSVVDFPQPDGPTKTMNSPSATVRLTASTASVRPNRLVTLSRRISAIDHTSTEPAGSLEAAETGRPPPL